MKAIVVWERGTTRYNSISEDDMVEGFVMFTQFSRDSAVHVKICLDGLGPERARGFHIHEKGLKNMSELEDDVASCCDRLGGHFNVREKWSPEYPHGTPHGKHTGDLCFNIISDEEGKVRTSFMDDKISLYRGDNCIIGRGLVIHEDEDDRGVGIYEDEKKTDESKKTGNAGKRMACGTIERVFD